VARRVGERRRRGVEGDVAELLHNTRTLTLFRPPLFAVYLAVIVGGLVRLLGRRAADLP